MIDYKERTQAEDTQRKRAKRGLRRRRARRGKKGPSKAPG